MKAETGRIVVLGSGIVGLCTALTLRERGLEVVVVDRLPPGSAQGSASYGNAGVVSPWSCVPQCLPGTWKQVPGWLLDSEGPVRMRWQDMAYVLPWVLRFLRNCDPGKVTGIADAMDSLMQGNVQAYRRFLSGTGQEQLLQDSAYINVYRGRHRPNPEDLPWTLRQQRGATIEFIDQSTLRDIEPEIGPEYHSAVIIKDQARLISPGRLCEVLAEKARLLGVTFVSASVTQLKPDNSGMIQLELDNPDIRMNADGTAARMDSHTLILCAGIGSSALLEPLGYRLPLMAERGYHLEFRNPGVSLNNSVQDMAGKFVVSSMQGGIRSAGTAEFASSTAPPNYRRATIFHSLTKRLLPGLNTQDTAQWMGIRPSFPDNLPAIGALDKHPGIIAAFGHSHYGMGMAPATARLVAELVSGKSSNSDMKAFRPARFTEADRGLQR